MGPLLKPALLNVIIYVILKFVVPNIPGSAPLPSSLIFLYLMLTTSGIVIFATAERGVQRRLLGSDPTVPDGREHRRAASYCVTPS